MTGAAALVLVARISLPEAGVAFVPPAGWSEAPALARQVARGFAQEAQLAGAPAAKLRTGGRAWTSPADAAHKAVLHLQWIVAEEPTAAADLPALVRAQLDDTRQRPRRLAQPARAFELVAWDEQATGTLAWAQLEHRHVGHETRTLARTSLFVDAGGHVHEIRVECVMADGEGARVAGDALTPRTGCETAMKGVSVLASARLQPLGDVPDGAALADQLADAGLQLKTPTPGDSLAVTPRTPVRLDPPPATENHRFSRMLLVGGGLLVVLALAFTMGRRAKSE